MNYEYDQNVLFFSEVYVSNIWETNLKFVTVTPW